jgi:hypothetical protein
MTEAFYRRGLLHFQQLKKGVRPIIEPHRSAHGVHGVLGIVEDPEIKMLYSISALSFEEWQSCKKAEKSYRKKNGKNTQWEGLRRKTQETFDESTFHDYLLQLKLCRYFGRDYTGEYMIYLYQGWVASPYEPFEWATNPWSLPNQEWGTA